MSFPQYVGAGGASSGIAAITPALPAGIIADDVLVLLLETANQAISIPTPNGGTWTEVAGSPQGTGTAGGTTATRLTVFWSRYNGTQGAPTTSDSGDHQNGQVFAFRGCPVTGDPWDVTSANVEAASDTSLSVDGATTTVPQCLVLVAATLMDDLQDFGATWTNADLANITVSSNFQTAAGNNGRAILLTSKKIDAGAYAATTNTLTAASVKAFMTIALKSAPDANSDLVVADSQRARRSRIRRRRPRYVAGLIDSWSEEDLPVSISENDGYVGQSQRLLRQRRRRTRPRYISGLLDSGAVFGEPCVPEQQVLIGPFYEYIATGAASAHTLSGVAMPDAPRRMLLVWVFTYGQPVTSVTWGGLAMSMLGQVLNDTIDLLTNVSGVRVTLWYLPGAAGTGDVVANLLASDWCVVEAQALQNVRLEDPFGTVFTSVVGPPGTAIQTTVTATANGGLVVDGVGQEAIIAPAIQADAGQDERANAHLFTVLVDGHFGNSSENSTGGGGSNVVGWSTTLDACWAHLAVEVRACPAAAAPPVEPASIESLVRGPRRRAPRSARLARYAPYLPQGPDLEVVEELEPGGPWEVVHAARRRDLRSRRPASRLLLLGQAPEEVFEELDPWGSGLVRAVRRRDPRGARLSSYLLHQQREEGEEEAAFLSELVHALRRRDLRAVARIRLPRFLDFEVSLELEPVAAEATADAFVHALRRQVLRLRAGRGWRFSGRWSEFVEPEPPPPPPPGLLVKESSEYYRFTLFHNYGIRINKPGGGSP